MYFITWRNSKLRKKMYRYDDVGICTVFIKEELIMLIHIKVHGCILREISPAHYKLNNFLELLKIFFYQFIKLVLYSRKS